jgi:hypothetical protein
VSLILGGFMVPVLFPNNRKHYKIYEENGEYYYKNRWNILTRTLNEKVRIVFEDDLALIHEYKTEWGMVYTISIWKYIDKNGNVVLRPDVYISDAFSEGLAAVMPMEGQKWGYMDIDGNIVIEPQYLKASMFKNGAASVFVEDNGGKWILINKKGDYLQELDEPLNWESHTQADPKNDVPK